ncbi:hypothetical protein ASPZODRAFT_127090 [Penicilliopsis zonata CBS 506.65]|uniref:DUF4604 domain-containing protein n=1 Tax=Penicilliopsis zonata CBS 506.65 TaxID=1073090 RepID=A0A1L9SV31_9EURO|nr:hypothetical protein ASPZODRAFT_127090 [Penicilliopsis zonata CBS 506.65]OJJ51082.1 hypothetical protein ASPZODRAFT_127090 [Penicilliopsis zonata CBS 506.65]
MSFKGKNLSYESNEPAFIRRLKSQFGSNDGRLERPAARPRLAMNKNDDDDEPTYVDEATNEVITKEEYEMMVQGSSKTEDQDKSKDQADQTRPEDAADKDSATGANKDTSTTHKQAMADIGGPKKRKQAKVIQEDNLKDTEQGPSDVPAARKPKQKKKKIKLSFDDE